MRVLGSVLSGALALITSIEVQAGSLGPSYHPMPNVGTVTGVEHPAPRVNGTADRFRRIGFTMVLPAGGPAVRRGGSPPIGSGVPRAGLSIIRSRIGEARPVAGVIHSQQMDHLRD